MTARRGPAPRWTAVLLAGVLVLAGCSSYTSRNARLRGDVAAGRLDAALRDVDKAARGKDRLLNLLERALVLHLDGRWRESNAVFEAAERLSADLYTRSIGEAALSLLSNDEQIAYRAAPFELALIPYYRALNYAFLGERDEAVVEARKAALLLRKYKELTLAALAEGDTTLADAPLQDHAFLHYLQGMLFEWGGELNDAFIAYRDAARAYRAAAGRLDVRQPWRRCSASSRTCCPTRCPPRRRPCPTAAGWWSSWRPVSCRAR